MSLTCGISIVLPKGCNSIDWLIWEGVMWMIGAMVLGKVCLLVRRGDIHVIGLVCGKWIYIFFVLEGMVCITGGMVCITGGMVWV